ncbi:hypothetical protein BO83DRAFT_413736 [Aspergillus eucalypticola CBS 122712]|uniref:Transcription factor domain-containing protein n=1 Tax=Aspergillus eucalypticola (strain CBS 122712 / IBT 29274) TaxID=1448314 RepID=A0A317WJ56_ASPEC|nr:uncharacterized protein BO83DRAFT_413736 [Aspergillus eucalypticola CBS 122712]PWY84250.1 hypothetical protein BO83DRAFT_413736 [Aspergillus eucalypticola CBS 122712]
MRLSQPCIAPENHGAGNNWESRIDTLQKQVDSLVTQVASMKRSSDDNLPFRTPKHQFHLSKDDSGYRNHHGFPAGNSPSGMHAEMDFISRGLFTLLECEELLAKFRLHKMPLFPFVMIPTQMGIPTLRQQFPFLLLCIVTACLEHKPSLQDRMEQEVRRSIATRLMVNSERSLDLLLGLLVHVAWGYYHWPKYSSQTSMFLQMAAMIVGDLGLDKGDFKMQASPVNSQVANQMEFNSDCWTSAAQRAFLGCYYLCSRSLFFRGQLAMKYTEWIKRCTEMLALKAEYPTDVVLGLYAKECTRCRTDWSPVRKHFSGTDESMAWRKLSDSLALQQKHTEELLRNQNLWDNWAVRLELSATSILVLGRHHCTPYCDLQQLQALSSSAYNTINMFLAISLPALVHLPASSYNILWYSLLLLSKLHLLSHARFDSPGFKRHDIHTLGLALLKKVEGSLREYDALISCKMVLTSMLVWLENTTCERQQEQLDFSTQGSGYEHESTRLHHLGPHALRGHAREVTSSRTVYPGSEGKDREMTLWENMLDEFDWHEDPSGFDSK